MTTTLNVRPLQKLIFTSPVPNKVTNKLYADPIIFVVRCWTIESLEYYVGLN